MARIEFRPLRRNSHAGLYISRERIVSGGPSRGRCPPTARAKLQSLLRRQQITSTKMSEKGKEFNMPTFGGGVNAKELAIFTRQFSVMIDAGLPLVQCLEILAGQQENKTFQKVLTGTRASVEGGSHAFRGDEAIRQGLRPALRQHGGSGRDGRYSRHHSAAPFDLHRKERQAEARREIGVDLSDRRVDASPPASSSCCCGKSCRFSPRCSTAWASTCRCRPRSSSA